MKLSRTLLLVALGVVAVLVGVALLSGRKPAATSPTPPATNTTQHIEIARSDITEMAPQRLQQGLPVSGTLRAVQTAVIKARVAGELMDLQVREGDSVQAAQVLARIDPTEFQRRLRQAEEQAEAARTQIDIAQRQFDNNRALVDQGFISKTALDTSLATLQSAQATFRAAQAGADVARKSLDDSVLKAPFSGVVSARLAQPGERMAIDARVLELVNLATLELEATLSAADSLGALFAWRAVDGLTHLPALSFLMISSVPYRAWPRFSFRTIEGTLGILLLFSSIVALFVMPQAFFFPVGVSYVVLGIVMALLRGAFDLPSPLSAEGHPEALPTHTEDRLP